MCECRAYIGADPAEKKTEYLKNTETSFVKDLGGDDYRYSTSKISTNAKTVFV